MSGCRSQFQIGHVSSVKTFIIEKILLFTIVQINLKTWLELVSNFKVSHHGVEISVIRLVKRSAIKLLVLIRYYGKTDFEVQRGFNANTTLVALFEIHFRSLFFDVEKRRQCSEVIAIP